LKRRRRRFAAYGVEQFLYGGRENLAIGKAKDRCIGVKGGLHIGTPAGLRAVYIWAALKDLPAND
jgi:hypothetical protein